MTNFGLSVHPFNFIRQFKTISKIMKLIIEIKAGEGGKDAQLLVETQASVYAAYADVHGLICRRPSNGLG